MEGFAVTALAWLLLWYGRQPRTAFYYGRMGLGLSGKQEEDAGRRDLRNGFATMRRKAQPEGA
jgi:hypothetical protein